MEIKAKTLPIEQMGEGHIQNAHIEQSDRVIMNAGLSAQHQINPNSSVPGIHTVMGAPVTTNQNINYAQKEAEIISMN